MDKILAREFGTRLKKWRVASNMTQHDLGVLCGISPQSISAIENGDAMARMSTIVDIVRDGFEMSFTQFFTGTPRSIRRQRVSGMPVPHLRAWRVLAHVSKGQLAVWCNVSLGTIGHLENGGNASPALAHRIAHIFGKTLQEMEDDAPIIKVQSDPAIDYIDGKSIEDVARELDEEYVQPKRLAAAEKKLDTTMADLGISKPVKKKALVEANKAGVVTASPEQILAWLQEGADEARARRLEEEVEEE